MPKFDFPVPETESTVTRPIVLEVVRQLMKLTGINEEHTQIFFPGDTGRVAQVGSTLTDLPNPNLLPFDQRIAIEVDEEYREENLTGVTVHTPENRLIFMDNDLDTVIRPVYVMSTLTLNFRYRAPDKVKAERWRDEIFVRMSQLDQPHLMNVSYHFAIPEVMLVVLENIHKLREANHGYDEDYPTYFNKNSSKRLSLGANQAGQQAVLIMSETQVRIPAMFDFNGAPEKGEKQDGGEAWEIAFSYKFEYAKPVRCQMTYPLVVHNTPMPEMFLPNPPADTYDKHLIGYSASMSAFREFDTTFQKYPDSRRDGFSIPAFDEFVPEFVMPATQRVVTCLTLVDESNPQLLMNLSSVDPDFEFKADVLAFLKGEVASLTKPYESIFHLTLYRNIDMLPADVLEVQPNLDVKATRLLSLRHYYHVRLAMVNDLRRLKTDALDRARNHGSALVEILKAIEPTLEERGLLPTVRRNNYVTRADLEAVIRHLEAGVRRTDASTIHQFNTVQTLFVKVSA